MPRVAIRIDPRLLQNPDTDVRYELPDVIANSSGGSIRDDGYDYEADDVMVVYLDVGEREQAVALIERLLAWNASSEMIWATLQP